MLKQPVYAMIPVNLTEQCEDRGSAMLQHVEKMSQHRSALGLLIFSVVTLIGIIASSIVAAISLSQTIQTAHYVNQLTSNVSQLMATQEDIDRRLEARLAAPEAATMSTGDGKIKTSLRCHSNYVTICVTL